MNNPFDEINEKFTNLEELINSIKKELVTNNNKESDKLLTRKEVSKMLGISLVTLSDWTKRGVVPAFRIESRIRYKEKDVLDSLNKVETHKYRGN